MGENKKTGFIMINDKCVSMNKKNNNAVVWNCYSGKNQKWMYNKNTRQLNNMRNNKRFCLHRDRNDNAVLEECDSGNKKQMWFPDETTNGDQFMIRSGSLGGKCLKMDTRNGGNLIVENCVDVSNKLFTFQSLS